MTDDRARNVFVAVLLLVFMCAVGVSGDTRPGVRGLRGYRCA